MLSGGANGPAPPNALPRALPNLPPGFLGAFLPSPNIANGSANLCEHCGIQPKFFDGTKQHPYCGKTCALAQAQAQSQVAQSQLLCVVCKLQPRYNDGKKVHQYCGKTCAAKGMTRRSTTSSPSKAAVPTANGSVCSIPGCQKATYTDPSSGPSEFCSLKHKRLAEDACLWCKKATKQIRHFCSRSCAQSVQQISPGLLEVPEGHSTFKSVAEQFKISWRHTNKVCPTVRRVYKIIGTQASLDKYEAYRDSVEARGQFKASNRPAGNENRRWHGTRRECTLGDQGQTQFCGSTSCSLCCIAKTTYDLSFFKKRTSWGRFGCGIYTSSTSSKSDDYSDNVIKSPLKAILLNKVVVGKGCKMTHDNTTLTAPPSGYDSILAEKGGSLNHDEVVVYTNDAVRPSFLVMYDS
ncbi:hypothetical protein EW145_g2388 [Phellinidium pouzarii]|uniref:PARP catalytic domain-containing protein n=1 Tax=Phellinidium pouzarii TaxID=167371 RepID=A0A4S4LCP6_9AGAM|nr:hypothetical protein EW145_g2388 [Phellinidium pouzarii]